MAMEKARVYDFTSKSVTTVPMCNLGPTMVRARVVGVEGEVWIDALQTSGHRKLKRASFPDGVREMIEEVHQAFLDVRPISYQEWEDGFRGDTNPLKEIALFLYMKEAYRNFTTGRDLDLDKKRDIFEVVVMCVNQGPDVVHANLTSKQTLSRKRVREIAAFMKAGAETILPRCFARAGSFQFTEDAAPACIPIAALFDADGTSPNPYSDPRTILNAAEVILGRDVMSGNEFLVFGRETLEAIVRSGGTRPVRQIVIELDQDTTELESLLAVVQATKGRHEYQPSTGE